MKGPVMAANTIKLFVDNLPETPQKGEQRDNIVKRLHYAEGHIRAVAAMVEEDAYCMDIINQNHAVIEALKKINTMILEGYLGECAFDAVNSKSARERKKAVMELVNLYSKK
jgi:CsoR family transcriptional regulator, copper-sensing transcriptional repressor